MNKDRQRIQLRRNTGKNVEPRIIFNKKGMIQLAYEDGYEVVKYLGSSIEKFNNDPLIFVKAQQLFTSFMSRSDWPHCIEDLDSSMNKLLGISLFSLTFFFSERGYLDDDRIKWPDDLPEGYRNELTAFCNAICPVYSQYSISRTQPMKLSGISQSIDGKGEQVIRFIRMDGQYLDFQLDEYDIKKIIRTLNDILPPETDVTEIDDTEG